MTYRGKHPTRINTVASIRARPGVLVVLNNGNKYIVAPKTPAGSARMPRTGEHLTDLPAADYSFETYAPPAITHVGKIFWPDRLDIYAANSFEALGRLIGQALDADFRLAPVKVEFSIGEA